MSQTFATLSLDTPHLVGVLNVTPDSFSDGGVDACVADAVQRGVQMISDGASIIDVGGESTRPGAEPITIEEEIDRVRPLIKGLIDKGIPVSLDTRNAAVMEAGLKAGASIINDVSALTHDPQSSDVIAKYKPSVILMHMQNTPQTMQNAPQYTDVVAEVFDYLKTRKQTCLELGLAEHQICLDVGIGFGKTDDHNTTLLKNIDHFNKLAPHMMGISRKSFIGRLYNIPAPQDRDTKTAEFTQYGISKGIMLHRIHNVKAVMEAIQEPAIPQSLLAFPA